MSKQTEYIRDITCIVVENNCDSDIRQLVSEKYHITPKNLELAYPFNSEKFMNAWNTLCAEPKWRKKTKTALQVCLHKLSKVSEQEAIEAIIESIAGGYQGIFTNKNTKQNVTTRKQTERANSIKDLLTDPASSNY